MPVTREVKLKARVDSLDAVRFKLKSAAKFLRSEDFVDYFFKSDKSEVSELRLRSSGSSKSVTVKILVERNNVQVNTEYNFSVGSPEDFTAFLEALGFHAHSSLRKKVEVYSFGSVVVQLADVEQLGSFVEIVVHVKDHSVNDAKAAVEAAAAKLNLKKESFDSRYYSQIKDEP